MSCIIHQRYWVKGAGSICGHIDPILWLRAAPPVGGGFMEVAQTHTSSWCLEIVPPSVFVLASGATCHWQKCSYFPCGDSLLWIRGVSANNAGSPSCSDVFICSHLSAHFTVLVHKVTHSLNWPNPLYYHPERLSSHYELSLITVIS